jgi:hypothetical protein
VNLEPAALNILVVQAYVPWRSETVLSGPSSPGGLVSDVRCVKNGELLQSGNSKVHRDYIWNFAVKYCSAVNENSTVGWWDEILTSFSKSFRSAEVQAFLVFCAYIQSIHLCHRLESQNLVYSMLSSHSACRPVVHFATPASFLYVLSGDT